MENKHSNFAATRETPMLATLVLSLELGARTGGAPVGLDLQSNSDHLEWSHWPRQEETLTSPEKFPVEIVPQSKPPYDMIEK
ncbi:hypothetical protein Pint_14545 [Pistacia integerrima]|uniref:Uncharacterized protein n=1 Tax=Pistacia integerrima TaxID=434235 RepID=A0ACC0Y6V5_9ROSI|nr:hypothetical protein Pint_14545 [Pistacia integerrima]